MTEQIYRAKAPLRVSFAGGGTDVPPFPEREGGLVLSATINQFAYGSLRPRPDATIGIQSLDLDLAGDFRHEEPVEPDDRLALVKGAIRKLGDASRGFDLFLHSSAPPGSGLGSSSAMVVALIGVLRTFHRLPLTDYEVAQLAYSVEREDLGLLGGLQDQYASTFGGFNFIEFYGDRVIVNPLRIHEDTVRELEYNMLLCFTGKTRASDRIVEDQTQRYAADDSAALEGLRKQKELAVEMKNALLRGKLSEFGELLGVAWKYKRQMSPKISNDFIDEAYEEAMQHGALGGKVTGAGGGGYMLFYCRYDRKHLVAEALTKMGASVTDFAFEPHGLRDWSYSDG